MESIFIKFQKEIITALALILIGAGVGNYTGAEKPYDPYEGRVSDIDAMMRDVINNPTQDALEAAQYNLSIQGDWSFRQTDDKKVIYEPYLEACNSVVIALYYGEDPNLLEMTELKNELI